MNRKSKSIHSMHSILLRVQKKNNENIVHFRHFYLKDESLGSEIVEILQHNSFFLKLICCCL